MCSLNRALVLAYAGVQLKYRRRNRTNDLMRALAVGLLFVRLLGPVGGNIVWLGISWCTLIVFGLACSVLWANKVWKSTRMVITRRFCLNVLINMIQITDCIYV